MTDRDLLGITPDLTVHAFRDRLEAPEEDEPISEEERAAFHEA